MPLAVCLHVHEMHDNLLAVLNLLDLSGIKYFLAADLKLINVVLGLSGSALFVFL